MTAGKSAGNGPGEQLLEVGGKLVRQHGLLGKTATAGIARSRNDILVAARRCACGSRATKGQVPALGGGEKSQANAKPDVELESSISPTTRRRALRGRGDLTVSPPC
jgi:hypothetical protein